MVKAARLEAMQGWPTSEAGTCFISSNRMMEAVDQNQGEPWSRVQLTVWRESHEQCRESHAQCREQSAGRAMSRAGRAMRGAGSRVQRAEFS